MNEFELTRMLANASSADLRLGPYKIPVHIDNIDMDSRISGAYPDINIRCSVMRSPFGGHIAVKTPRKIADPLQIKKVIYNAPATIVLWADGTKTVVKCTNEEFDPEKGLAMAIAKKALGNRGNYYETFKKFVKENEK